MPPKAWTQAGPSILASFLAAAVESVGALTVILAVGAVRGRRDALLGAGAAACVLPVAVAASGAALARIPSGAVGSRSRRSRGCRSAGSSCPT